MTEETMTLAQLKEYIRNMPEDEILAVRFEGETDDGRNIQNDGDETV